MSEKKNQKIVLWLGACLAGSIVSGLILVMWLNLLSLDFMEVAFVILIMFILSLVVSIPLFLYGSIRMLLNVRFQPNILECNVIYTVYFVAIFLLFPFQLAGFFDALQLMSSYFIAGLIALNVYLR